MTGWFFANLAWASLLMLVVLAARRPFAALFGAGPAYALWLLPALRLVMPQMPSLAPDLPALAPAETLVVWVGDAAAPLPPQGGPGQWVPLMLAIWALGAAAFLLWQFVSYRRFVAEMRLTARSLGNHGGVPLIESGAVQGPVALGLIRRRIVVPADFDTRYTAQEQRLALEHERVHHRRGDIWWNHLGLIVLALNWFNPVAWLAFRAFRIDQELACDAAVAAGASPETRHDYARALIKSASRPGLIAACPLNHADQLKRRLKMMKTHKASRLRLIGGAAAVTLLAGAGLALGSPGFAQAGAAPPAATQGEAAEGQRSEERIIIRTHQGGAGGHGAPDVRTVRIHHGEGGEAGPGNREEHRIILNRGPDGHGPEADMADCDRGQRSEVNEGEGNQRTRIILCTRGTDTATPAQRAERLQSMRDRLANDSELTAEQRSRVSAAIDREIARLRAQ